MLLLVLVPRSRSGRRRGVWRTECLSIVCSVLCPCDVRRIIEEKKLKLKSSTLLLSRLISQLIDHVGWSVGRVNVDLFVVGNFFFAFGKVWSGMDGGMN